MHDRRNLFSLCLKHPSFSKKKYNDLIGTETNLLYRDPLQIEAKKQITMTVYN